MGKMNDNQLDDVVGGKFTGYKEHEPIKMEKAICADCGKEFERVAITLEQRLENIQRYGENLYVDDYYISGWLYRHDRCSECLKKNPFPGRDEWSKSHSIVEPRLDIKALTKFEEGGRFPKRKKVL